MVSWEGKSILGDSEMAYQFPPDVEELVTQRMASGDYGSEDDVLRDALKALTEQADDLAAVQAAVTGLRAGEDGQPLGEAFDDIRRKHNISADT